MCQQHLVDEEILQGHMDLEYPMVAVEPVMTEEQVTRDSATLDTNAQIAR